MEPGLAELRRLVHERGREVTELEAEVEALRPRVARLRDEIRRRRRQESGRSASAPDTTPAHAAGFLRDAERRREDIEGQMRRARQEIERLEERSRSADERLERVRRVTRQLRGEG